MALGHGDLEGAEQRLASGTEAANRTGNLVAIAFATLTGVGWQGLSDAWTKLATGSARRSMPIRGWATGHSH